RDLAREDQGAAARAAAPAAGAAPGQAAGAAAAQAARGAAAGAAEVTATASLPRDPIAAAARLAGRSGRVLLHSGRDDDGCGRLSFVACEPLQTIEARGRRVTVRDERGAVIADADADPFAALE